MGHDFTEFLYQTLPKSCGVGGIGKKESELTLHLFFEGQSKHSQSV